MKKYTRIELVSESMKFVYATDANIKMDDIYRLTSSIKTDFFAGASPVRVSIEIREDCHEEGD